MINAVLITTPGPPFLTPADLDDSARRLAVVSDVSCDVGSACNMLPIYSDTTSWAQPARRLRVGRRPPASTLPVTQIVSPGFAELTWDALVACIVHRGAVIATMPAVPSGPQTGRSPAGDARSAEGWGAGVVVGGGVGWHVGSGFSTLSRGGVLADRSAWPSGSTWRAPAGLSRLAS